MATRYSVPAQRAGLVDRGAVAALALHEVLRLVLRRDDLARPPASVSVVIFLRTLPTAVPPWLSHSTWSPLRKPLL